MDFNSQSYEILIIGLMVMGFFLVFIPVGQGDSRLRNYRISVRFLALSFVLAGAYCLIKIHLPRELLFIPFFVSSHIQACLLGLAHLNLVNINKASRRQVVLLNFSPMLACMLLYAAVQPFCPFVHLYNWDIFFHSLSNPSVIVRTLWLVVYVTHIIYYAAVFAKEERKYSRELGDFLSDTPGVKYRLALISFCFAQAAGANSICICLTLNNLTGGGMQPLDACDIRSDVRLVRKVPVNIL